MRVVAIRSKAIPSEVLADLAARRNLNLDNWIRVEEGGERGYRHKHTGRFVSEQDLRDFLGYRL